MEENNETQMVTQPQSEMKLSVDVDVNTEDEHIEPLVTKEESLEDVSISQEIHESLQMNAKGSIFRTYLHALKGVFSDRGVEINDVPGLIKALPLAMELIEFGYKLDGPTKKKYVIFALRNIIKDTVLKRDEMDSDRIEKVKSLLLNALDSDLVGNTIDVIIDATKAKLFINKPIQLFFHRLFSKIKSCFTRESSSSKKKPIKP